MAQRRTSELKKLVQDKGIAYPFSLQANTNASRKSQAKRGRKNGKNDSPAFSISSKSSAENEQETAKEELGQ
jgi:hypothetical protein